MADLVRTRFTERFGLAHPIALAPMNLVSGGSLAAAVSAAGGLGLIGAGYGDADWLATEFAKADPTPVGVGVITWSMSDKADLVDWLLQRRPMALMVAFGDGAELAEQARGRGVPVLWQVQTLSQARQALACAADVIVVQGQEAGGHGMSRGLMSLLPAVRDIAPAEQIILGAGGIADGRGLAAVLALGGDGVLMGTRFWASKQALGAERAKQLLVDCSGDQTLRTQVFDILRGLNWPAQFSGRVVRNALIDRWHSDPNGLRRELSEQQQRYRQADPEDYQTRVLIAGEALDLVHDCPDAGEIVTRTAAEAASILSRAPRLLIRS